MPLSIYYIQQFSRFDNVPLFGQRYKREAKINFRLQKCKNTDFHKPLTALFINELPRLFWYELKPSHVIAAGEDEQFINGTSANYRLFSARNSG